MPYQNLDSEIMLAFSIWFLAISIFAVMLVMAIAQIISENRAKMNFLSKSAPNRWNQLVHTAVSIFQKIKRN